MQNLILFFKGIIIGIGKIIPGVSGSLLAISLGVYETALQKINNLLKEPKASLKYLIPLALGIVLAILCSSKIILYLLNHYYIYTIALFIGLIIGTIPTITKEITLSWKNIAIGISIFFFLLFGYTYLSFPTFVETGTLKSKIFVLFLGGVDAITTILPGLSGTATFFALGSYDFVLNLFASPFTHIFSCILFGIGFIMGFLGMIKIVNFLFKHHRHLTWVAIFSFLIFSIFSLILKIIDLINQKNLLPICILFYIGYSLTSLMNNES